MSDENRIAFRFIATRQRRGQIIIHNSEYYLDSREKEKIEDCFNRHLKGILDQLARAIKHSPPDLIEFDQPKFSIQRRVGALCRESRHHFARRAKLIAEPIIAYWLTKVIKPNNNNPATPG